MHCPLTLNHNILCNLWMIHIKSAGHLSFTLLHFFQVEGTNGRSLIRVWLVKQVSWAQEDTRKEVSTVAFSVRQQSTLGEVLWKRPCELRILFPLLRDGSGKTECNYKKLVTDSEKDSNYWQLKVINAMKAIIISIL